MPGTVYVGYAHVLVITPKMGATVMPGIRGLCGPSTHEIIKIFLGVQVIVCVNGSLSHVAILLGFVSFWFQDKICVVNPELQE
jgi:hypothetical protein